MTDATSTWWMCQGLGGRYGTGKRLKRRAGGRVACLGTDPEKYRQDREQPEDGVTSDEVEDGR